MTKLEDGGAARSFVDPEFTGDELLKLVIDLQAVVGTYRAGCTPLGSAVIRLAQVAADSDALLTHRRETAKQE